MTSLVYDTAKQDFIFECSTYAEAVSIAARENADTNEIGRFIVIGCPTA